MKQDEEKLCTSSGLNRSSAFQPHLGLTAELFSGGSVEMTFNFVFLLPNTEKPSADRRVWNERRRHWEGIPMLPTASNTLERTSCISYFLTKICFPQRPNAESQACIFLWLSAQVSERAKRPFPGEKGRGPAGSSLCRLELSLLLEGKGCWRLERNCWFTSEPLVYFGTSPRDCGYS